MKRTLTSLVALTSVLAGFSQASNCDDPLITSWEINTDGTTAEYLQDCCPQSGTDTQVLMDDTAGVKQLWYNTNNVYVLSESLAYSDMGSWPTLKVPSAQGLSYKIPRTVTKDLSGDENTAEAGTIGIAVNGVLIFAETTSNSYNNATGDNSGAGDGIWNEDAYLDEAWSMDEAFGHANNSGQYHYHTAPVKLYGDISAGHSPIIGWALDGVPIYGPYGYANANDMNSPVVRMETGYELRVITDRTELVGGVALDASEYGPAILDYELGTYVEDYEFTDAGHLDEHNGRFAKTPDYPEGVYAYYVTLNASGDPEYPYFIGPEYYGERPNGQAGATIPLNADEFDPLSCVTANAITTASEGFNVFPNPTNGNVRIEFPNVTGTIDLTILDFLGNEVFTNTVNASNTSNLEIGLPDESGLYLIQAIYGGEAHTVRISKQ